MPAWLGGTIGVVILVALWEVLAVTVFDSVGSGVPPPTAVGTKFVSDWSSGLYGRNVGQTLKEAGIGYVWANLAAVALGIAFVQIPSVEKLLLQAAVASYCLPIIAVGPILTFVLHGDAPEAALAGLLVFFPSLMGVVVGLRSADRQALDLVRACGGGSWDQLVKVRLRAALPSTLAAFRVAAPAAILGALVGEYLGAQGSGLGIMMIDAESSLDVARTWGIALFCTVVAGLLYLAIGWAGRWAAPWHTEGPQTRRGSP
jgi:ABC-type nitrate/sulfonate/bicarbonate transport system permease component